MIIIQIFQRLPNKLKFMISTCKCYLTLDSSIALPDWIMILMKTWLPFATKPSALAACPVIENICSKPSGFVNFQLALNLFPIMGELVFFIDLVFNTGGNITGNGMTQQNTRMVYYMLYLENVKNYDQSFLFLGGIHMKVKN